MSQIRSKDTKPEMVVRRFLFKNGFRYRLHDKKLPGKPDIVLSKYKTVIQIQGCFWHGHKGCKYFKIPSTRTDWWAEKINRTKAKDIENKSALTQLGWQTIIVWECDLRSAKREETLNMLLSTLR